MKRYLKYKESHFSGIVPSGWKCWKLRHAYKVIGSGTTPEAGNPEYYDHGTINWLNTGDLNNSILKSCSKKVTQKALRDFSSLKVFPKYSLAIAMYGATIGKVSLLEFETTVNQACCVFSDSEVLSNEFMFYWFLAHTIQIVNLSKGGGQPNVSKDILSSLRVFCPSLSEQTQIAQYLDQKISQIDKLITDKEKLIELLNEERNAIINQAVTKGLNPDVPMKDSGIEWLGEVPEHWEVKRLKYIKSSEKNAFVDGPFGSNLKTEHFIEDGDVFVIDSGFITSGEFHVHRNFKMITQEHFETVRRSECKANDIIISKIGANFGMSGILPELNKPALVSGNTLKLTVDTFKYNLELIHFHLLNLKRLGEIDLLVKGSAQPALSMGGMNNLPFPLPLDINEQLEVVKYIKFQTERINSLILKIQQEIQLLKEYKTALISEVVTGKVDVRDEVIAESTELVY